MMLEYPMELRYLLILIIVFLYGSLLAQIPKRGVIDGETWTADDSLYIIIDNITVLNLIIEPGVIVQFDDNHKFEVMASFRQKDFIATPSTSSPSREVPLVGKV